VTVTPETCTAVSEINSVNCVSSWNYLQQNKMLLCPQRKTVKGKTSKEMAGDSKKALDALLERKMKIMTVI